ncbi:helix-turn-helix domain-containing protein [Actinotalea sp.]|uniref:helix-turn-helix domain-containing protein n=1 Tax=Actinotalea sp. TaxID=1872145 RepID=UPI003563D35A
MTPLAYTIPDAAQAVGLSERSIRDAIRRGDLAPRYFGSKPLIPAAELDAWLHSLPSERSSA